MGRRPSKRKSATRSSGMTVKSISQLDLHYIVSVDCDYDRSGCECDGICHCERIVGTRVTSVHVLGIVNEIAGPRFSEITRYGVDRIIRAYRIYDTANFDVNIRNGYYGQEIGRVSARSDVADKIDTAIRKFLSLKSLAQKVEFLLTLEYGYLLDGLKKRYKIMKVDRKDVAIGHPQHYRRLERPVVDQYKDYNLPIAVCISENGRYRLIDGYHRYSAFLENHPKALPQMIVAY